MFFTNLIEVAEMLMRETMPYFYALYTCVFVCAYSVLLNWTGGAIYYFKAQFSVLLNHSIQSISNTPLKLLPFISLFL